MTETPMSSSPATRTPGRRAHWTTALVLAPAAAAVFGATMSWAAQTRPTTAASPGSVVTAPPRPAASTVARDTALAQQLQHELAAKRSQRAQLADQLTAVRSHLVRIKAAEHRARKAAGAATAGGQTYVPVPTGNNNGGGNNAQVAPVQVAPVQVAPVQVAPVQVAAPPPPVQAVTGASGKP